MNSSLYVHNLGGLYGGMALGLSLQPTHALIHSRGADLFESVRIAGEELIRII